MRALQVHEHGEVALHVDVADRLDDARMPRADLWRLEGGDRRAHVARGERRAGVEANAVAKLDAQRVRASTHVHARAR